MERRLTEVLQRLFNSNEMVSMTKSKREGVACTVSVALVDMTPIANKCEKILNCDCEHKG